MNSLQKRSKALLLAGHGSQRNPGTRAPICACVKAIRALGTFDEVCCRTWKQEPHLSEALNGLHSEEVVVVPFFISDGYYTRVVIPREMGLDGAVTERDGRRIHLTPSVGQHPRMADLIWQEAVAADFQPDTETLVVLGHGTPRNPASATNIFLQAERLRRRHPGVRIRCLFIDQEPGIHLVNQIEGDAVMVPMFISDGWHVTETIPEDLGLEDGRCPTTNGELRYTPAVGTDPSMVDVVLELAAAALEC